MPRFFKIPISGYTVVLMNAVDLGDSSPETEAKLRAAIARDNANGWREDCTPAEADRYRAIGLEVED